MNPTLVLLTAALRAYDRSHDLTSCDACGATWYGEGQGCQTCERRRAVEVARVLEPPAARGHGYLTPGVKPWIGNPTACKPSRLCWLETCDFCLPKLSVAASNRGDSAEYERFEALIDEVIEGHAGDQFDDLAALGYDPERDHETDLRHWAQDLELAVDAGLITEQQARAAWDSHTNSPKPSTTAA